MAYINDYGLINGKFTDGVSENGLLIAEVYSELTDTTLYDAAIQSWIVSCYVSDGLYHNRPPEMHNGAHEDYTSPDQVIAYLSAMKRMGYQDDIDKTAKYLRDHWGNYNNLGDGKLRIQQPLAYGYAQVLANHWTAGFWRQFLKASFLLSCSRDADDTSGKQKAWLMLQHLDMPYIQSLCGDMVGGWPSVFKTYYPEEAHPIRLYIDGLYQ